MPRLFYLAALNFVFLPFRHFLFYGIAAAQDNVTNIGIFSEFASSDAANGMRCFQGYEIARHAFAPHHKVGKRFVDFIFGDHNGTAAFGIERFNHLINRNQIVAAVTNRSEAAMAMNAISRLHGIPLVGIAGHPDFLKLNPLAFRAFPSVEREAPLLARAAISRRKKTIAIVTLEDEWTSSFEAAFTRAFARDGGRVVLAETVQIREYDFAALVGRIKEAAPDAILVNVSILQATLLITTLRRQQVNQQLLSTFWGAFPEVIDGTTRVDLEGLLFVSADYDKPKFLAALLERFPAARPTAIEYCCYAGLGMLIRAIEAADSASGIAAGAAALNSSEIRKGLEQLRKVELLDGSITVANRELEFEVSVKIIRGGKVYTVQAEDPGVPAPASLIPEVSAYP